MLFTGLSASLFWPLTAVLERAIGSQAALLAFAALNAGVAFPLHVMLASIAGAGARCNSSPSTASSESLIQ
jgi:hypothetical protein